MPQRTKMRVMCFCTGLLDYTIQLSNALSKKETIMLVLPKKSKSEHFDSIDKDIILNPFPIPKRLYNYKIIISIYTIYKYIVKFKPDVIHIQGGNEPFFLFFKFFCKYPLVTTFHDIKRHTGEERLIPEIIMFFVRKFSNRIIVHSETLKKLMINEYNTPKNKIFVTQFGEHEVAPFKKYEIRGLKEEDNQILFFGRIWKYKGLEYLIKAEPIITKEVPNTKIIIAGTGEDFKRYKNIMINKDNFIVYNYRIPYNEGAELFQKSSVVVLPYIEASQSGVILTAYGFKKPVVATNVGAIPEAVDDGVTGLIVPPRDPEALAEAIIKLLKNEKLRKQMGENAYKKLKNDFSWTPVVEKTIEVYKEAIRDRLCN